MKEIISIIDAYNKIDFSKTKAALATVVRVDGSSYRRTGARMLIQDNGTYTGGISGGCLEGDTLRKAQHAIGKNKPSVITYDTTRDDSFEIGIGLGCNGIIDILITPLNSGDIMNPVSLLSEIARTRVPALLLTIVEADKRSNALGRSILYKTESQFFESFELNDIAQSVFTDLKQCLKTLASQTISYHSLEGEFSIFFEIINPPPRLVIYGGNYDIYPLARIAKELGWSVIVIMNLLKANKELFAIADKVLDSKGTIEPEIDKHTAVILMSHDYNTDYNNLQKILKSAAIYIGILGPRKRSQKMFDTFVNEGRQLPSNDMDRIYSPAGLDIGAKTPEEIAISIVSEIVSRFEGRNGISLRSKEGSIHGH